jgi:hypothetical protein
MTVKDYADLARKLWPFMAGYVQQTGGTTSVITAGASSSTSGDAAPAYASFLTLAADPTLTQERTFAVSGLGLSTTDGGAGSTYTLTLTSSSNPGANARILASDANGFLTLPQFLATTKVRTPLLDTASGALTLTPATGVTLTDGKTLNGSTTFVSGFAGAGWRIDQGVSYASQSTLEVDNVIVRGLMRVYELVINKIRVSRGSMIVSPGGGKVATVSGSGPYTLTFDDDHGILANDLLRAQKFTGSGTYQSLMTVTSVSGLSVTATLNSGVAPAAGYEYAVIGNTSNASRQGGLFLTADDSGAPFMDIYDGVTGHSDFNTSAKTKARLGRLTGITDSFFGTLTGYGLYTNRAYLNGAFINGSLVVGPGVGFTVSPIFYCGFDTPRSGNAVNTNGHRGQPATVSGGVIGTAGKFFGGAVTVGEATTNRVLNPSVETNTTGYASDTGTLARSTDYALFGSYSLKYTHSSGGSGNTYYNVSGTLATSTTFTFSVYARRGDGAAVSGVTCFIDSSLATITPTISDIGNGWYRIYATRTIGGSLGNHIVGISGMANTTTWYFDGWQVEARAFVTPYLDGSLGSGVSWAGTAHASTSSRTAASIAYPVQGDILPSRGSISMWILVEYWKTGGAILWTAGAANTDFQGQISQTGIVQLYVNGNVCNHQTAAAAGWHHVAFTWDVSANQTRVYLDGVASTNAGTTGSTPPPLHASTLQVGCSSLIGSGYNFNGAIDEFAVLNTVLTADEVRAIYSSNAPLNIARSNYELVLSEVDGGRVIANAAGIYGTDAGGKPTFSLVNAGTTVNGEAMTAGDTMLGDNSSGKGNVLFDQSAGSFNIRTGTSNVLSFASAGSLIEGVLNFGTSGGIYQGSSGSFASPGNGIKIWRGNGTTDGGTAGDCIIGVFDAGAYTMSITPSAAITIVGGTGYEGKRALSFVQSNGTKLGEVYSYTDGSTYNAMRIGTYSNSSSRSPVVYVDSKIEAATGTATAQLIASKFVQSTIFYDRPRAVVSNTVNVGTPSATVTLEVYSKNGSSATAALTDNNGTTSFTVTAGSKSWRIDHPLRPTTHWLDHVAVEGDGHFTFYRGNVVLDSAGLATVQMPDWFDALNDDVSIVYSSWGDAQPARTSRRIANGWEIVGQPGAKVSWMASGLRADAWAKAHPFTVEVEKEESHQGTVFTWKEHGLDESFAPPSVLDVNPAPAGQ